MTTALVAPPATQPLPHTLGLPPAVLAVLLQRELVRLAGVLEQVPDLEEAGDILVPSGVICRVLALGTAALPWVWP